MEILLPYRYCRTDAAPVVGNGERYEAGRGAGGEKESEFCTILLINLRVPVHVVNTCRGIYITAFIMMLCVYIYIHTHLSLWSDAINFVTF
jgi:hypothetical protein